VTGTASADDLKEADLIIDGLDQIQLEAHNDALRLLAPGNEGDRSG
jgi:hypothetical protein